MDDKLLRHQTLSKLLKAKRFASQEDVVSAMSDEGFDVTQSSISRDFRELGIVKIGGRYLPSAQILGEGDRFGLQRLIVSIDTAGANLVVIKTSSGAANAVAEDLDLKDIPGFIGTVAGDNTFFVATKNKAAQLKVIQAIKGLR